MKFNNSKSKKLSLDDGQPASTRTKCPVCGKGIDQHGEGLDTDQCVIEATGTKVAGPPSASFPTALEILNNDVPAAPRAVSWSQDGMQFNMTFSNGMLEYGPTYALIVCAMILRYAGVDVSKKSSVQEAEEPEAELDVTPAPIAGEEEIPDDVSPY